MSNRDSRSLRRPSRYEATAETSSARLGDVAQSRLEESPLDSEPVPADADGQEEPDFALARAREFVPERRTLQLRRLVLIN